jgi:negative regulator of flagellin synthesis FlgM
MRIKDASNIDQLTQVAGSKKQAKATSEAEDREEKVTTSQSDELARAIVTAQTTTNASRAQVVAALATAVRQGTYKPDPQKIAQQILEDAEIIAKLQAMLKH